MPGANPKEKYRRVTTGEGSLNPLTLTGGRLRIPEKEIMNVKLAYMYTLIEWSCSNRTSCIT